MRQWEGGGNGNRHKMKEEGNGGRTEWRGNEGVMWCGQRDRQTETGVI